MFQSWKLGKLLTWLGAARIVNISGIFSMLDLSIHLQPNLPMQSPVLKGHFFCSVIEHFTWTVPLLRGHLSCKATLSLSQMWPLNTGLTVCIVNYILVNQVLYLSVIWPFFLRYLSPSDNENNTVQYDVKHIMMLPIKTIRANLKVSTYIITCNTGHPIAIPVIMSVTTFKTAIILYISHWLKLTGQKFRI